MKEDAVEGDPFSARDVGLAYHAYSASGDVTAPIVYANSGNPADYAWLADHGVDVSGKIVLVRYSMPYSYRGFKALAAEERGAAGILIYSDPAEDGWRKGKVYPDGPWGPDSHIQRGGIVYDFRVPGDPLTPGWASVPGARRIAAADAVSLPKIISVPLSSTGCPPDPETRSTGARRRPGRSTRSEVDLPLTYRIGGRRRPGPHARRVQNDDRVRPIWTVIGRITGSTVARRSGDCRQPPRRLGLWRRRSVERHGVDDGAGARARRAREARHSAEADDRVRELGRGRVHAHLVHRMGRAARARARRPCGCVSERRQLGVRPRIPDVSGSGAEPRRVSERARRPRSSRRRVAVGHQPAGQRIRLHGLSQPSRRADRRPVVHRPVRRVSLDLRQPPVGEQVRRSRICPPRADDPRLGRDGAAAGERRHRAARLPRDGDAPPSFVNEATDLPRLATARRWSRSPPPWCSSNPQPPRQAAASTRSSHATRRIERPPLQSIAC